MDLLSRISEVVRGIDFDFEVELVPDGKYGAGSRWSGIWNGMIGEVVRGVRCSFSLQIHCEIYCAQRLIQS